METTLLTVGLVCVIAAIVGGGLRAFQIELPGIASVGRQALLGGFGILLIVLALVGVSRSEDPSATSRPSVTAATAPAAETTQRPYEQAPGACLPEIAIGTTTECAITRPGEEGSHTFTGNSGDRIAVRVASAGNISTPESVVLRPDGSIECGPGYGDIEDCTLDATGTHTVVVTDGEGSRTGSYVLRLERGQ